MQHGLANLADRPQFGFGSFIKKAVKKISKPIKKIIPKEIRPFVPAVAGMFLGPAAGGILGKFGAGLAAIALAGAGVGIGIIFGNYLSGAMRNPSAAQKQFPNLLLGFALAEATGLFGLVVALIILFAF